MESTCSIYLFIYIKCTFVLNRAKHILPHKAMKSLYFALIQSRLQYGIEAWGLSNNINKLLVTQKRAIRAITNKYYRQHTDPLFKATSILKGTDLHRLQVCSFMYDLTNNKLPCSFRNYIPLENESNYTITTRQKIVYTKLDREQRSRRNSLFISSLTFGIKLTLFSNNATLRQNVNCSCVSSLYNHMQVTCAAKIRDVRNALNTTLIYNTTLSISIIYFHTGPICSSLFYSLY